MEEGGRMKHLSSHFRGLSLVLAALLAISGAAFGKAGKLAGTIAKDYEPVRSASLELVHLGRKIAIDWEGNYAFADVPPGWDTLRITDVGFHVPDIPVKITSGLTTVVKVRRVADSTTIFCPPTRECPTGSTERPLPGTATLFGRVLNADTSRPVFHFEVDAKYCYRDTDGIRWEVDWLSAATDEGGHYVFNNLHPGEYQLFVGVKYFGGDVYEIMEHREGGSHVVVIADSLHKVDFLWTRLGAIRASEWMLESKIHH
jgi:hypothetical protein